MEDCWSILGLDAATATERDVKAAYAKLLKVHRPDVDPEGFQRVRQAYFAALAFVHLGKSQDEPSTVLPQSLFGELKPTASSTDIPEWVEAVSQMRLAFHKGDAQRLWQVMSDLGDAGRMTGRTVDDLYAELRDALTGSEHWFANQVTDSVVLGMLLDNQPVICDIIFSVWEESGDVERMLEFSKSLVAHSKCLGDEEAAVFACRVARSTGFWSYPHASALLSCAYPMLTRSTRILVEHAEERIALGYIFSALSMSAKKELWPYLSEQGGVWQSEAPESHQAAAEIAMECGVEWPGFELLKRTLPGPAWETLMACVINARRKRRLQRALWHFEDPVIVNVLRLFYNLCLVVLGVGLLFGVLRECTKRWTHRSPEEVQPQSMPATTGRQGWRGNPGFQ